MEVVCRGCEAMMGHDWPQAKNVKYVFDMSLGRDWPYSDYWWYCKPCTIDLIEASTSFVWKRLIGMVN